MEDVLVEFCNNSDDWGKKWLQNLDAMHARAHSASLECQQINWYLNNLWRMYNWYLNNLWRMYWWHFVIILMVGVKSGF